MANWYYLTEKRILELILIIMRSSVVVEITAGKIIHMSIQTFSTVSLLDIIFPFMLEHHLSEFIKELKYKI